MELVRQAVIINYGAFHYFKFLLDTEVPQLRPVFTAGNLVGSMPVQAAIVGLSALLLLARRRVGAAAAVVVFAGLALAMIEGLRWLMPSVRPPMNPANGLEASEMFRSFPAAPVLLSFVTLLNLALACESWRAGNLWRILFHMLAVGVALWVTISQLFLGLHFLTDVLAGMTAGVALALLCRGLCSPRYEPSHI